MYIYDFQSYKCYSNVILDEQMSNISQLDIGDIIEKKRYIIKYLLWQNDKNSIFLERFQVEKWFKIIWGG